MNKLVSSILSLSFLSIFFFVACQKNVVTGDLEPPTIYDVRINKNDTFYLSREDGKLDTFYINTDSLVQPNYNNPDTIILGHFIEMYAARFMDNEALMAYKVQLEIDPGNPLTDKDSLLFLVRNYGLSSLTSQKGVTDSIITKAPSYLEVLDKDSLKYTMRVTTDSVPRDSIIYKRVHTGRHYVGVYCIDRNGNESSLKVPVVLIKRDSLRSIYQK